MREAHKGRGRVMRERGDEKGGVMREGVMREWGYERGR